MKKNNQAPGHSDWIQIRGLRLKCHIGVSPQERRRRQTISADIALKCSLRRAGQSDRLADTIDYATLAGAVARMAGKKSFCLLESLAENIAVICLANKKAAEVIVKLSKSGVLPNIRSAEVEIMRQRGIR